MIEDEKATYIALKEMQEQAAAKAMLEALGVWSRSTFNDGPALKLVVGDEMEFYIVPVRDRLNAPFDLHAFGAKLQFGNVEAAKMHAVKVWRGMQEFK